MQKTGKKQTKTFGVLSREELVEFRRENQIERAKITNLRKQLDLPIEAEVLKCERRIQDLQALKSSHGSSLAGALDLQLKITEEVMLDELRRDRESRTVTVEYEHRRSPSQRSKKYISSSSRSSRRGHRHAIDNDTGSDTDSDSHDESDIRARSRRRTRDHSSKGRTRCPIECKVQKFIYRRPEKVSPTTPTFRPTAFCAADRAVEENYVDREHISPRRPARSILRHPLPLLQRFLCLKWTEFK